MRTRTASLAARKDTIMHAKNWIAIGAASALGLGVMAAGAVSTASALPLIAGATNLEVPGITVSDNAKGTSADLDFSVSSDSIVSPDPVSPASAVSAASDSPVSPASAMSAMSPASVVSPASVISPASVMSPASVISPASVASVGSSD